MKQFILTVILFQFLFQIGQSQTYNADYVHKLYAKYPTVKSDLCKSCKEWDNPIFKSIADTAEHRPVITFYIYTNEHRLAQEKFEANYKAGKRDNTAFDRSGVFAGWHPVTGQPELSKVYSAINKPIKKVIDKWVWGHCQAWILLAYCQDGAILSDTEDFNEGMEVQGQNVGTEIATEEHCRALLKSGETDLVKIWCGTVGNQGNATDGKIRVIIPAWYWKIIQYKNKAGKLTTESWFMPNQVTETTAFISKRVMSPEQIIKNIGFDPLKVFF